jgi:hypothetical protein
MDFFDDGFGPGGGIRRFHVLGWFHRENGFQAAGKEKIKMTIP